MAVTVKLRYLRHSAKKLRPYARIFVGQPLERALTAVAVMPQDSARFLQKAFKMAEAAAATKEFNLNNLEIAEIFATEGPKIKRMRPNARGRSNKYEKLLAHLSVVVRPMNTEAKAKKSPTKAVKPAKTKKEKA